MHFHATCMVIVVAVAMELAVDGGSVSSRSLAKESITGLPSQQSSLGASLTQTETAKKSKQTYMLPSMVLLVASLHIGATYKMAL